MLVIRDIVMATSLRSITRIMRRKNLWPVTSTGSMLHSHAASFGEDSNVTILLQSEVYLLLFVHTYELRTSCM